MGRVLKGLFWWFKWLVILAAIVFVLMGLPALYVAAHYVH